MLTDDSYCKSSVPEGRRFCERCQAIKESELEASIRTAEIMQKRSVQALLQLKLEGEILMPGPTRAEIVAEVANDYIRANPERVMSDVTFGELSLWLLEQATIEEHKSRELVRDAEALTTKGQPTKCYQNDDR